MHKQRTWQLRDHGDTMNGLRKVQKNSPNEVIIVQVFSPFFNKSSTCCVLYDSLYAEIKGKIDCSFFPQAVFWASFCKFLRSNLKKFLDENLIQNFCHLFSYPREWLKQSFHFRETTLFYTTVNWLWERTNQVISC